VSASLEVLRRVSIRRRQRENGDGMRRTLARHVVWCGDRRHGSVCEGRHGDYVYRVRGHNRCLGPVRRNRPLQSVPPEWRKCLAVVSEDGSEPPAFTFRTTSGMGRRYWAGTRTQAAGPIIVTAGAVTACEADDPACKSRVYTQGMGFVNPGGTHVHVSRSEGPVQACIGMILSDLAAFRLSSGRSPRRNTSEA
jgi:hypothetical protein